MAYNKGDAVEKKYFVSDGIGSIELLEVFGDDLTVVNAARVSFSKESHFEPVEDITGSVVEKVLSEKDKALINFLAKYHHDSPFFHPQLRFRIKMPIFVAREWWRSTIGFSRNEVSRRYVTDDPEFFMPTYLRKRDTNVKQGSSSEQVAHNEQLLAEMADYYRTALVYYKKLMESEEVCPEQARMILPQAMYTEFIETASLAGYARLVRLRNEATAQREIQSYAKLVSQLIEPEFPISWAALITQGNAK